MRRLTVILAMGWVLAAASAAAQLPPPPQDTAGGASPDIVRTQDGGMLRGTIIESVPGQYVLIQLPTGETRRVDGQYVTYAGPAAQAPGAQPPQAPGYGLPGGSSPQPGVLGGGGNGLGAPGVPVRFESEEPGISFHRVTGTATAMAWGRYGASAVRAYSFERVCGAPCVLDVVPGNYHLAISRDGGQEIVANPIDIPQAGTVHARYIDRRGIRIAGWLTFIGGLAVGLPMMLVPLAQSDFSNDDWVPWLIAGAVVTITTEIVGLIMAFQGDGADLQFRF
jgi:hypothetical protein